jgi:hypothetical protein
MNATAVTSPLGEDLTRSHSHPPEKILQGHILSGSVVRKAVGSIVPDFGPLQFAGDVVQISRCRYISYAWMPRGRLITLSNIATSGSKSVLSNLSRKLATFGAPGYAATRPHSCRQYKLQSTLPRLVHVERLQTTSYHDRCVRSLFVVSVQVSVRSHTRFQPG